MRTHNKESQATMTPEIQVRRAVAGVIERSMVLRDMIEKGEIGLIGAMYDVASGAVQFFDETYMCGSVRHFYLDAELHVHTGASQTGGAPERTVVSPNVGTAASAAQTT